jgi:hypothetical protein
VASIDDPDARASGEPGDPAAALRDAIHKVNNYLAAVNAYAEAALAKNDPALDRRVLEMLVAKSRELEAQLKEIRRRAEA